MEYPQQWPLNGRFAHFQPTNSRKKLLKKVPSLLQLYQLNSKIFNYTNLILKFLTICQFNLSNKFWLKIVNVDTDNHKWHCQYRHWYFFIFFNFLIFSLFNFLFLYCGYQGYHRPLLSLDEVSFTSGWVRVKPRLSPCLPLRLAIGDFYLFFTELSWVRCDLIESDEVEPCSWLVALDPRWIWRGQASPMTSEVRPSITSFISQATSEGHWWHRWLHWRNRN